jgi:hypothetical protein
MFVVVVPTIAAHPEATRTDIPAGELAVMANEELPMMPVVAHNACAVKRSY